MSGNNIPVGMLQNDELYNILSSLALSGGADIKTLYLVAHSAGIQEEFMQNMVEHGIANNSNGKHLSMSATEQRLR